MNGRVSNINCTIAIGWEGIYFGSCGDMSRTHVHNAVKELVALLLERRRTTSCPGRLCSLEKDTYNPTTVLNTIILQ
jgi:hypothetical protein